MPLGVQDLSDAAYEAKIHAEIDRLASRINDQAVCQLASKLNGGRVCSIEYPDKTGPGTLMGAANYHARIRFHDGFTPWLLRVPRVTSHSGSLPDSLVDYLIKSEYTTLKFLEETAVPAPRAFAHGTVLDGNNAGVGIGFLLMEELPGKPWIGEAFGGEPTAEGKEKVRRGLAEVLVELERYPLARAGSLNVSSSGVEMGSIASDRFLVLDPAGTFETAAAYYSAFAEQYLALIADGQLYTEYPVNAYLLYRFLKDNVAKLVEDGQEGAGGDPAESFFLKHVDDKGDHLLVDEDLNITGVIDWQMARVVPRSEAFGPSLVSADMDALCGGDVSLSGEDRLLAAALAESPSPGLAAYMADERARKFFWGLGMEREWEYALPLADAILTAFGAGSEWSAWREGALREYGDDERLQKLLSSRQ